MSTQDTNHTESNTSTEHAPGTYYVADDGYGGVRLWTTTTDSPVPVASKDELDDRDSTLWPVLTGVLTRDDETVERVARSISGSFCVTPWDKAGDESRGFLRGLARAALSGVLPSTGAEVTS